MIFALCGRKRSGKSTLSKIFKDEFNGEILSFGRPLKNILMDITGIDTIEELDDLKNSNEKFKIEKNDSFYEKIFEKTNISENLAKDKLKEFDINTIREALQIIGTDLIRFYNPLWHINETVKEINKIKNDKNIIIDDCRFYNELQSLKLLNAEAYFIVRPTIEDVSNHISETELKWYNFNFSNIIINDSEKKEFIKWWVIEVNRVLNNEPKSYNEIIYEYKKDLYTGNEHAFIDNLNKYNLFVAKKILDNNLIDSNGNLDTNGDFDINNAIFNIISDKKTVLYNPLIIENLKLFL